MTIFAYVIGGLGLVGIAFGLKCYHELHKWARECQNAQIVVAYKRKVKLAAPVVEWLLWIRQLDKDRDARGRVIYSIGGTSVAIVSAKYRVKPPPDEPTREGRYTAKDETVKT